MKELKTYREVLKAIVDGKEVEIWHPSSETWTPYKPVIVGVSRLDDEVAVSYRIKLTKPSINWEHVHPKYRYLARDILGKSYLYQEMPHLNDGFWRKDKGSVISADAFVSLKTGNCNCTESLVERPEGV